MINKASLMRKINKSTYIPLRDASLCIDVIIEEITEAIARGERVELRNLGSFFVREVATKKAVFANIPAHGRIAFRPCQKLRQSVWNRVSRLNEQIDTLV